MNRRIGFLLLAMAATFVAFLGLAVAANASPVAGDLYEPNDTTLTATQIAPDGVVHTQYFDDYQGADYLSFPVRAGKLYLVEANAQGHGCWGNLTVIDGTGQVVAGDPTYFTFYGSVPQLQSFGVWIKADVDATLYLANVRMDASYMRVFTGASTSPLIPYTVKITEHDPPIISGTVRNLKTGMSAAGVVVRAWTDPQIYVNRDYPFEWSSYQTTTTAADGTYALKLARPGRTWVRFEDAAGTWVGEWYDSAPIIYDPYGEGVYPTLKEISAQADVVTSGIDGHVCRPGAVDIRVEDAVTGESLPGLQAGLWFQSNAFWRGCLLPPRTDDDGRTSQGELDPRRAYTPVVWNLPEGIRALNVSSFTPSEGETTSVTIKIGRIPFAISLAGPGAPITPGTKTTLPGSVSWSGAAVEGAIVTLEESSDGIAWAAVDSMTSGVGGGFKFSVAPQEATQYRVTIEGTSDRGPGTSDVLRIDTTRTTALKVSTSTPLIAFGATGRVEGRLTWGSSPEPGQTVILLESVDGTSALAVTNQTAVTNSSGAFTFAVKPASATRYGVRFAQNGVYLSSESSSVAISPRANLTRPVTESTMTFGKAYDVYGYLTPRHPVGKAAVRLYCYKWDGSRYVQKMVLATRDSSITGTSKFSMHLRLPSRGKWAIRAYHADDGHAATWSAKTFVTVK